MTPFCQDYISRCVRFHPDMRGKVLEVGSMDVSGNPRCHFDLPRFTSYIGIDMRPGPCVDIVANCHDLSQFHDGMFDVVVDAERLEHDCDFFQSYREISRVISLSGYVIITTRSWGGFAPHDHPSDYWRFLDNGLKYLLEISGFECLETEYGEDRGHGHSAVCALGRKI